ncbi:hypothetical protein GTA08_BOTSDO13148 [Botryosphaeria dothidea]|uniref:Uncharacterized protein n=1 Tax=Botryosphaeria dothidea TaxID=55169 RepID=A0A8H4J279_9PEZI|nr:hypothetical protein GTA08_BOTSDO13148 [Botryosphaeria dothidea]
MLHLELTPDVCAAVQAAQALLSILRENQFSPPPIFEFTTENNQNVNETRSSPTERAFESITENDENMGKPSGHHQVLSSTETIHKKRKQRHERTVNPKSPSEDPKAHGYIQPAKPSTPVDIQEEEHAEHQALSPGGCDSIQYIGCPGLVSEKPLSGTDAGLCDTVENIFSSSLSNLPNYLLHDTIAQIRTRTSEPHISMLRELCRENWKDVKLLEYYEALGIVALADHEQAAILRALWDPAFTPDVLGPIFDRVGQDRVRLGVFSNDIEDAAKFAIKRDCRSLQIALPVAQSWFLEHCNTQSRELVADTWCVNHKTNWGIQRAIREIWKGHRVQKLVSGKPFSGVPTTGPAALT